MRFSCWELLLDLNKLFLLPLLRSLWGRRSQISILDLLLMRLIDQGSNIVNVSNHFYYHIRNSKTKKKNWNRNLTFFGKNLKTGKGVPLVFFRFSALKFLGKFSGYYDWNLLRDTKSDHKHCLLAHNSIERPGNAKVKSGFCQMSWGSCSSIILAFSRINFWIVIRGVQSNYEATVNIFNQF